MHADATKLPDAGAMTWSDDVARSGGITIGARPILVAYNVNVDEQGAAVARKIGSIVRSSGRLLKSPGGVKFEAEECWNVFKAWVFRWTSWEFHRFP